MRDNLLKVSAGLVVFFLLIRNPEGSAEFVNLVLSSLATFVSKLGI